MNKITEKNNISSINIDTLSTNNILQIINDEDSTISEVIKSVIPDITKLVDDIVTSFNSGNKLYYLGCGSSGRLGVLDAVECPPTFSTKHDMIQGIIAGGDSAMFKSVEKAEDLESESIKIVNENLLPNDMLICISASGTPAYITTALKTAKKNNVKTCLITCNDIKNKISSDHLIKLLVGPEIISGSTRMKSGTATKMVLNMISTSAMIKIHKTYGNLMVDLKVSNKKLKDRAIRIIKEITTLNYSDSGKLLIDSNNNVKAAIVMHRKNISYEESLELLIEVKGNLRKIID